MVVRATRGIDEQPAPQMGRQRAAGGGARVAPHGVCARGDPRRVRARPCRVAGERELPDEHADDEDGRHRGQQLDGRLSGRETGALDEGDGHAASLAEAA
jgi:hypothetical protein